MVIIMCKFYGLIVKLVKVFKRSPYSNKNIITTEILKKHQRYLYKKGKEDYKKYLQKYTPDCDYLNFSLINKDKYTESNGYHIENGLPLLYRYGNYVVNHVVFCQYALLQYGNYINYNKNEYKIQFLFIADKLCEMQDENGSYLYYYDFPYYLNKTYFTRNGWTGAMQHGQVLSVLYRAYKLTNDNKYLIFGDKIIDYLSLTLENNGVKGSLSDLGLGEEHIFFEEWTVSPESYTLNGFIFVLLGLYDWSFSNSRNAEKAKEFFDEAINSLKIVIPLYDMNGGSTYDLGHITYKKNTPHYMGDYHAIHIAQCYILYHITGEKIFNEYFERWRKLVD